MRKLGTSQGQRDSEWQSKARSAYPQRQCFLWDHAVSHAWHRLFSSILPSPLHTSVLSQASSLSHPNQSMSSSALAQGRSVVLYDSLLLVSSPPPLLSIIQFPTMLPHTRYIPADAGLVEKGENEGPVLRGDVKNPTVRVTAWVDKGCQEQKSEHWSPLTWRMKTRWASVYFWGGRSVLNLVWGVVYMGICICQNHRTLYLKCIYSLYKIRTQFKNFKEYSVFLKNASAMPHRWLPFKWHGFYLWGSVWVLTHMLQLHLWTS